MNEEKRLAEVEKFKMIYETQITRAGADRMMDWLEEKGFFEAPASTKYHGSYAGGLVEHSNNVYERLLKLAIYEHERLNPEQPEYYMDSLATVSLLHDVCKADAYKMDKDGKYTYTNAFPIGHGEKSVMIISRFMPLSKEEMLAIRWHMGAWDNAVQGGSHDFNNAISSSRLVAMLHIADMMATYLDEREEKATDKDEDTMSEWEVVPGPGGWMVGWFVCKNCGHKEAKDKDICPGCKAKMKKIKWG